MEHPVKAMILSGVAIVASLVAIVASLAPRLEATYIPLPAGAVVHWTTGTCPSGWSEITTARGRYIVGLPSGGTNAGTAGTALSNTENRPVGEHTHEYLTFLGGGIGSDFPSGATAGTYGATQTATSGAVAGTNAPYIQYITCSKN